MTGSAHLKNRKKVYIVHFYSLRNKTCFQCLHSLVKTEANVWENSSEPLKSIECIGFNIFHQKLPNFTFFFFEKP